MSKLVIEVKLKEGTDEPAFINEFDSVSEVTVKNTIPDIPTLLVMNIEESYLSTFQSHSSVECAEETEPVLETVTYPSIPSKYTLSGKKVNKFTSAGNDGTDYIPYQFYLDTDLMLAPDGKKIGCAVDLGSRAGYTDRTVNDQAELANQTYSSNYTGKYVDIVTMEAGQKSSSYANVQNTHPEFDDPDNTGTTRCIPRNWYGCEGTDNNQVTDGSMFSSHALGVLSAAGGVNCGFAKKAKLYSTFLGRTVDGVNSGDSVTELCEAIIHFHNNKSVNSTTGIKDPTVVIGEFQVCLDHETGVKVEDIGSITDASGTTNRPGSGWGSDLTPFTSRSIFPYRIQEPDDNSWHWMVAFPRQTQFSSWKTALDSLYDNGITFITAAGNNGGVYVKESDARWSGTYCTVSGTVSTYDLGYNTNTHSEIQKGTTTNSSWKVFTTYGPHGYDKAIDVAAGQNSETYSMLDGYSNRGPGVDVVGLGGKTFSADPETTMADGNKWGNFGGTSCAAPTVVGKAACMMEEYYTLNGAWPTPAQIKNMLVTESRNGNNRVDDPVGGSTTWSNVPTASGDNIHIQDQADYFNSWSLLRIPKNSMAVNNGGFQMVELAGSPHFRAYWNARCHSREHTRDKRPTSGVMFPRPRHVTNIE